MRPAVVVNLCSIRTDLTCWNFEDCNVTVWLGGGLRLLKTRIPQLLLYRGCRDRIVIARQRANAKGELWEPCAVRDAVVIAFEQTWIWTVTAFQKMRLGPTQPLIRLIPDAVPGDNVAGALSSALYCIGLEFMELYCPAHHTYLWRGLRLLYWNCFNSPQYSVGTWPRNRGLIPGRGKVYLFSKTSRPALGPTQLPVHWVLRGLFLRG